MYLHVYAVAHLGAHWKLKKPDNLTISGAETEIFLENNVNYSDVTWAPTILGTRLFVQQFIIGLHELKHQNFTGLCDGIPTGYRGFLSQRASEAESVSGHDVIMQHPSCW